MTWDTQSQLSNYPNSDHDIIANKFIRGNITTVSIILIEKIHKTDPKRQNPNLLKSVAPVKESSLHDSILLLCITI